MTDTKRFSFSDNPELQKLLLDWWQGLDQARGDRAELRRATRPAEVAFCPSFHRLLHSLHRVGSLSAESLAVVAGVLSHIKYCDESAVFAAQMATPKPGADGARVSGLRFRRLLKFSDREELYQPLIRTVRLLDGRANLISLADGIYFWGENVRKQWAYSYYEKTPSES
jgi:CRISPR system Cascade subunit CasB